jgi:DNA polymerase
MPEEIKRELLAIADALDGLLHWERELAGEGFPAVIAEEVARRSQPPAAAPASVSPAPQPAAPSTTVAQPPAAAAQPAAPPLHVLQTQAASCTACGLHTGRTHSVFARGSGEARVVFVGEGPGYHEDQQGEPFVGPAGELLDKMIVAMGYQRDEVYVCNVVKCRPPDNRTPLPDEAQACAPFLHGQLANVRPQVIVALGKCATEALGCMTPGQKRWRGVWSEFMGVPVMPTYHPAFLLRSPQFKRDVWDDLQLVMGRVDAPGGGGGSQ